MDANVCRGDRVSSKFVAVKGLDDVLKRLRFSRRGSSENGGDEDRPGRDRNRASDRKRAWLYGVNHNSSTGLQ